LIPVAVPWILVAGISSRALTVVTQLLVGFLLVPEQVGTFAVAAAFAGMATPFQSGDHARLALQDPADPRAAAAVLRNWLLAGCLASCAFAVLVLPLTGATVALAPLACLSAISLLRVLANLRSALLSARGRSGAIAVAVAGESHARCFTVVGMALAGAGVWSLVFGEVAAVLASLTVLDRFEPGPAQAGWRMPAWMPRQILATLGVCLLVGVELNCSAVAIGQWCDAHAVGSFAFANRIAAQIGLLVQPLIALEAVPRLIAARRDPGRFHTVSRQERRRLLRIVAGLVGPLVLLGPPAMILVWGGRWREAAAMLPWLGLSLGLRLFYVMAKAHLEALGAFTGIFVLSCIDTALILGAVLAAAAIGGAQAVVAGLALESAVILAIATVTVRALVARRLDAGKT
jgi:PST family polysaccharide transporter